MGLQKERARHFSTALQHICFCAYPTTRYIVGPAHPALESVSSDHLPLKERGRNCVSRSVLIISGTGAWYLIAAVHVTSLKERDHICFEQKMRRHGQIESPGRGGGVRTGELCQIMELQGLAIQAQASLDEG